MPKYRVKWKDGKVTHVYAKDPSDARRVASIEANPNSGGISDVNRANDNMGNSGYVPTKTHKHADGKEASDSRMACTDACESQGVARKR